MFFKRFFLLFAVIAVAALPACSLYEGPPVKKKKEFQKNSLGCMKDFQAKILAYVDGSATAEDVTRLSNCSIEALRTFGDFTRGESRDRFTAEEIRNFLQRYFLEDVTISDKLLKELMRVKQAFLGGKTSDFSREDLKAAEGMIEAFRDIFLRLQPSMPISLERMKRETPDYVEEAGKALIDAGEIFGRKISETKSTYSLEDMGFLFDELMETFNGAKTVLVSVRKNLKFAGVLKQVMIDPYRPREVVTARDWRLIVAEVTRWTATYIQFVNVTEQHPDWMRGEGRVRLGRVLNEALAHIDRMIERQCPDDQIIRGGCKTIPGIPFQSLQTLMDTFNWDEEIPGMMFQKTTLINLVEPLIKRMLGGADLSESGRNTNRLTSFHIERLRTLLNEWLDGARYVEGAYAMILRSESFSESSMVTTESFTALDPKTVLENYGGASPEAVKTAESLRILFKKTIAIEDGKAGGAVFDGKNASRGRVYRELARYTWLRPLFKRVVLGYSEGPGADGLKVEEFTALITDYWQLLGDAKFVGPKNNPVEDGRRRFREASLFFQVSNGDPVISADEGLQLVLYMFSGSPLSVTAHRRAAKICKTGPMDDYNEPTIETNCYRRKIYDFSSKNAETAYLWKAFPLMIEYYDGLDSGQQSEFKSYVELASRKPGVAPGDWFGSDSTQVTVMIFHYVEALFLRFDTNQDGFLDQAESEIAFPIFKNTLSEISGMNPTNKKLESVFFWLLTNGAPPVNDGMNGWRRFWNGMDFMVYHWRRPAFKSDRLSVLKVFATLAAPVASARP